MATRTVRGLMNEPGPCVAPAEFVPLIACAALLLLVTGYNDGELVHPPLALAYQGAGGSCRRGKRHDHDAGESLAMEEEMRSPAKLGSAQGLGAANDMPNPKTRYGWRSRALGSARAVSRQARSGPSGWVHHF